jgi:hypothetical protein
MANDPLSQFRKAPADSTGGTIPPTGADEYAAFGTKDKVHRLKIRSNPTLVHSPGYNLLLDVVSDGQHGTNFVLVYTVLLVMVRGRNLQKMVFAIENGMADFIQQFDPERWQKPTDADAPLIESIEIQVTEGGSRYGDTKH